MKHRAFTLLEVLVSIALIIGLVGVMYGFLFNLLDTRASVLEASERNRTATMLIERLESDLLCCVAGDSSAGAGLSGDETSIRVLTRNVAAGLAQRGPDDSAALADLQFAEYRFTSGTGEIQASRGVIGDSRSASASGSYNLGGSLYKVRFRFHDGNTWRDSFDSRSAGALPQAVEVAVWFHPWPGEITEELEAGFTATEDEFPPDRLTFDAEAGFDESEYAEVSDIEFFDEPAPDRVRVIVIPDAGEEGDDAPAG
ncbi:MAG: prepilin-type N-terminal cleavage/methylation domain-containing protein [Phycisphaerales bacterium]|nr:MAG: prepilin-type N-terminal cleavage/methylation domain-containing protein [Phycisphaerales bacterium]